ncbi:MAG: 3-deoxy-D-manno-octulosonic acid kinase [Alcaligenaceae bacterium]|nr:3-deoxy-D-manno-octulosonic acid kinase [Alcaligenaceae bacterium]
MEIQTTVQGDDWGILIHPDWQEEVLNRGLSLDVSFTPDLFHAEHYQSEALRVSAGGRNAAWFIPTSVGPAVLRQYRRGGLIAKFIKTKYLFSSPDKTRAFQEFNIINNLHRAGLTVPKALGAFYQQKGRFCEMALITSLIADAQPLVTICQQFLDNKLSDQQAKAYTQVIASRIHQMHDLGVWHADLNAYNILCTSEPIEAYLIDFDKAQNTTVDERLRQQNLERLKRSLEKLCGEQSIVFMEQISENYHLFENN